MESIVFKCMNWTATEMLGLDDPLRKLMSDVLSLHTHLKEKFSILENVLCC